MTDRERERERERERHANIDMSQKHRLVPPILTPTGDRTHNLGMCPDQESNPQFLDNGTEVVYGTMFQPPESPGQDSFFIL